MSKEMDLGQNQNPLEITAEAALESGTLKTLAKAVNSVTLTRHFFEDLLRKEVGTGSIESEAIDKLKECKSRIVQGRGNEIGTNCNSKLDEIRKFREVWMVRNIIELKVKSLKKEEKETRKV